MLLQEFVENFFRACEWGAPPEPDARGHYRVTINGLYTLTLGPGAGATVALRGQLAAEELGDEMDDALLEKILRHSLASSGRNNFGLASDREGKEVFLYALVPLEAMDDATVLALANDFLHEMKLWLQQLLEATVPSGPSAADLIGSGRWRIARP